MSTLTNTSNRVPAANSTAGTRWRRRLPLLPALLVVVAVTQVPMVVTLVISTLDWNVLRPDEQGVAFFGNYATVFSDTRLLAAVLNTVVMVVGVVLLSILLGTALALLLDRRFPGRAVARTLLITPFLVMPMAAALLWKHAIFNPAYGLLNGVIDSTRGLFGQDTPAHIDWLTDYPMASVIASLVWQWTPFMMLIVLAGLQSRPLDVLEAARVDGADALRTFRFITLPHLRRYLELGVLLGTIHLVQTFDAVFVLTQGGPGTATTNLPYEIYLTLFRKYEYGEAAAAGVVVVIGSIVVAMFALRVVSSLFREDE